MSHFILGIDVGTTSVKAVLLAADSRSVAASQCFPTDAEINDPRGIKVSCRHRAAAVLHVRDLNRWCVCVSG